MRYNEIIRSLRKVKGMSQRELAERLGVTENYLWMIETKRRLPGPEVINKLGNELDFNTRLLADLVIRKKLEETQKRMLENLTTSVR